MATLYDICEFPRISEQVSTANMKFPAFHSVIGVAPSSSGKTLVYHLISRVIDTVVDVMSCIYGDSVRSQGARLSGKTVRFRWCGETKTFVRALVHTTCIACTAVLSSIGSVNISVFHMCRKPSRDVQHS